MWEVRKVDMRERGGRYVVFLLLVRRPPRSRLFPYATLCRSALLASSLPSSPPLLPALLATPPLCPPSLLSALFASPRFSPPCFVLSFCLPLSLSLSLSPRLSSSPSFHSPSIFLSFFPYPFPLPPSSILLTVTAQAPADLRSVIPGAPRFIFPLTESPGCSVSARELCGRATQSPHTAVLTPA